jgi:tetratricopeptide (TPR) repeat protein
MPADITMESIMLVQRTSAWLWFVSFLMAGGMTSLLPGEEALRQVHVGDTMPAFSLADPNGTVFRYRPEKATVLGVIVLQAKQSNLERLMTDLEMLAQTLKAETGEFDCVGVMSGPGGRECLRSRNPGGKEAFPILLDPDFALWGKLGVIAAPTAVVVGTDHKVQWVKAGYGYDFLAGFHAQLAKALGHGDAAGASVRVETLGNDSERARRDRHIQLARTLARKGRWDAAIKELERLRQSDPNAVDVALELGEVLCRAGRNEAALKTVAPVKAQSNADKARVLLVSAWARRQMGELGVAESLLTQALKLAPESSQILYELGKVHQAKGDAQKALLYYRKALAEVFGDTDAKGDSQK